MNERRVPMTEHLRFPGPVRSAVRMEPARLAVAAGIRAAMAIVVPLLLGRVLQIPEMMWAGIAAYNAVLADKGGAYRTRATTMGALSIAAAISAVVAGVAGATPWLAVPLAFLWVVAASLGRVYGTGGASVGLSVAIVFVISLALPTHGGAALERGALVLVGAAWAMLLTLALWPLRPYRPARLAVARCYRALADYATNAASPPTDQEGAEWQVHVQGDRARIREALEQARVVLAELRRGRQEESGRGARLLVLLEAGDQIFAQLLALADLLEGVVRGARSGEAHATTDGVRRAMLALAAAAREIAAAIEEERERVIDIHSADWGMDALRTATSDPGGEAAEGGTTTDADRATYQHLAHLVVRLHEYAGVAVEVVDTLDSERPVPAAGVMPPPREARRRRALEPLLAALARDSEVLRHALRVGITTAVAVLAATLLRLPYGFWVTITVLVILEPYMGSTLVKGAQRIAGTVAGGIIAAALAAVIHDPRGIMLLVAVLAATAVMLLPLNYGMFVVFLTPAFVLLVELSEGNWSLAGVRVMNTLLGGALAAAGSRLLWPNPEHERFPEQAAAALRAARDYLTRVAECFGQSTPDAVAAITQARRRLGLAAANAEASFQRLLTELPRSASAVGRLEPGMTFLIYTRRLGASATTLASLATEPAAPRGAERIEALARAAAPVLDDLAEALTGSRAPAPLPDLLQADQDADRAAAEPTCIESPQASALGIVAGRAAAQRASEGALLQAQLRQLARQIAALHESVARFVETNGSLRSGRSMG